MLLSQKWCKCFWYYISIASLKLYYGKEELLILLAFATFNNVVSCPSKQFFSTTKF